MRLARLSARSTVAALVLSALLSIVSVATVLADGAPGPYPR